MRSRMPLDSTLRNSNSAIRNTKLVASPATLPSRPPMTPASLLVQRAGRLLDLLGADTQLRQLCRHGVDQGIALASVLGQLGPQPGDRDEDGQDHNQGRRPPRTALGPQPALHRRHRDDDDQRQERWTDQPRDGLYSDEDHHDRGRTEEYLQAPRQADGSDWARAIRGCAGGS